MVNESGRYDNIHGDEDEQNNIYPDEDWGEIDEIFEEKSLSIYSMRGKPLC